MAVRFMENFSWAQTTNVSRRYRWYSGVNPDVMIGRTQFDGRHYRLAANNELQQRLGFDLPDTVNSGLLSFSYSSDHAYRSADRRFVFLQSNGTRQLELRRDSTSYLSVTQNGSLLGTSSLPVFDIPHLRIRIEVAFFIDESEGFVTVKVDKGGGPVTVLSLTDINTRNGVDGVNTVIFGSSTSAAYTDSFIDDVIFDDDHTAFRGDLIIQSCYADSDSSVISTPSAGGTNWNLLGDSPVDDTTYVEFPAGTHGADTYTVTDLASEPTSIYAVSVLASSLQESAGSSKFRLGVVSNVDTAYGDETSGSYVTQVVQSIFASDPQGNVPWTTERVNAVGMIVENLDPYA